MNTIASLTREQPEMAERVVEDLSELFRASIGHETALASLDDELDLARRYLEIERLRLGARLTVEWKVVTSGSGCLPPLTIQPLVENAVYHGIEPRTEGGKVTIHAVRRNGRLEVTITNPATPMGQKSRGNHVAVDNIRQRLAAHFGNRAGLDTETHGDTHIARLWAPCRIGHTIEKDANADR